MTRIDRSEMSTRCWRSDHNQSRLINAAREAAHEKHGDHSIEAVPAGDPRWLPILVEEIGEVAHALTYDADDQALADELLDVLAVAAAWLDALRVEGIHPTKVRTWLA